MGGVINDATATPETVRKGDIIYNNDRWEVGGNPDVKKTMTEIFTWNVGGGQTKWMCTTYLFFNLGHVEKKLKIERIT